MSASVETSLFRLWKITDATREQIAEVEQVCVDIREVDDEDLAAAAVFLAQGGVPVSGIGEGLGTVMKVMSFDHGLSAAQAAELVAHGYAMFGPAAASPIIGTFIDRVITMYRDRP